MLRWSRDALPVLVVLAALAVPAAPAGAAGPELSVSRAKLGAALECAGLRGTDRHPVLLIHGTGAKAAEHWGWNYANALPSRGYAVCTVSLPRRSMPDIQRQSEYVVFAVRRIAARSHRKVDVIGHSQGTLQPRWAIKWWGDVRRTVDDYISLAGPHHGTVAADAACLPGFCAPSVWQMKPGSRFLKALNRGDDTPGRAAFTSIYSATDELVQPFPTAALDGASNLLVQDICPSRPVPHMGPLWDAVVFALVTDALAHRGPARARRLPGSICLQALYPGLTWAQIPTDTLNYTVQAWSDLSRRWSTTSEPRLAPYAR